MDSERKDEENPDLSLSLFYFCICFISPTPLPANSIGTIGIGFENEGEMAIPLSNRSNEEDLEKHRFLVRRWSPAKKREIPGHENQIHSILSCFMACIFIECKLFCIVAISEFSE